jgi:hypothetical protein
LESIKATSLRILNFIHKTLTQIFIYKQFHQHWQQKRQGSWKCIGVLTVLACQDIRGPLTSQFLQCSKKMPGLSCRSSTGPGVQLGIWRRQWQDLHGDDKTCMQSSYWELILENGQWLGCWTTDGLCALPITGWTGIHGFGYLSPLIRIAPFSAHKLIEQDTAVLHQAIIV